jgi:ketosteroid isomerase-like protein
MPPPHVEEQPVMVKPSNEYERLYLEFFATLSSGDLEKIRATFHEDAVWQVQVKGILGEGSHRGRKAIVDDFLAPVRGLFVPGDPKVTVTAIASQGPLVMGECTGRGTLADGREYANLYVFVIEFKDGRVHQLREYMDSLYIARLQGLVS